MTDEHKLAAAITRSAQAALNALDQDRAAQEQIVQEGAACLAAAVA
jgi:hypothetical protein